MPSESHGQLDGYERFLVVTQDGIVAWESPPRWAGGGALASFVHPSGRRSLEDAFEHVATSVATDVGRRRVLDSAVLAGKARWRDAHIEVTVAPPGSAGAFLVSIRDHQPGADASNDELVRRASQDGLTALSNRSTLLSRLRAAESARSSSPVAVLYVDVDHFKRVNDRFGHAAGDKVLLAVADRLKTAVRPGDLISRIGGDEFVVVASGVADADTAVTIAQRISDSMLTPIPVGGRKVATTLSIGATVGPGRMASTLLEQADAALYLAKQRGRDRVELYHPEQTGQSPRRFDAESVLRNALDRDALVVAYEPVVDLATGSVAARRASLMFAGDDGLECPEALMRLAEESGLAVSLGAGLLDQACAAAAEWVPDPLQGNLPDLTLTMSPRHLEEARAADQVLSILRLRRLPAERLWVEVAEQSLVQPGSTARQTLDRLRECGVRIAVRDFGAGPANLAVLRRFCFDAIQIDPIFMDGFGQDARATTVVEGVVNLGRTLGVTVAAQGVLDHTQASLLRAMGSDWARGPYFGSPALTA